MNQLSCSTPDEPHAQSDNIDATAGTGRRARVAPDIESLIVELAFRHPTRGQDRIARDVKAQGKPVSASGVRYVWQRHNLETLKKRVAFIESRLGKRETAWSAEQLSARARVRTDKEARSLGASIVGQHASEVSRSLHILAVAARLLREQGYDATSLRDIARRAHIPLGSIYYHFPTKEELFAAVYEEGIRRLTEAIQTEIRLRHTPWERFESACIAHLDHLCGGDDFTAVSIPTNLPRIVGPIRNRLMQLNDGYEDIFRRLIADLDLPPQISGSLIRLQILGALNWTSIWYRPGKFTPREIATNLTCALRVALERKVSQPDA